MTQATHIYSKMTGTIIGAHLGLKAKLVKLPSGEKQYWKEDSIIKDNNDMNEKIMFRLSGPQKKTWKIIERYFESVDEAYEYLIEMKGLNDIRDFSKNGEVASMTNGWTISSNYSLKEILKNKPPKADLSEIYPFDLKKAMGRVSPLSLSKGDKRGLSNTGDSIITKSKTHKINGKMIKLQDLTQDTRKARVILRGLVRKKKIIKPGRWEWEAGSPELDIIKEALNKS